MQRRLPDLAPDVGDRAADPVLHGAGDQALGRGQGVHLLGRGQKGKMVLIGAQITLGSVPPHPSIKLQTTHTTILNFNYSRLVRCLRYYEIFIVLLFSKERANISFEGKS